MKEGLGENHTREERRKNALLKVLAFKEAS
jgi:hypothetical protein